jgi:hypothetical protein
MRIPENNKLASVCAAIGASMYGVAAIVTLLVSIRLIEVPLGLVDPINALLLTIVALVLVTAVKPLMENNRDGYAFIVVGGILAGLLFILQISNLGTSALGWMLQLEDWIEWRLLDDVTPQLWLFPIVLPILGLPWIHQHRKERVIDSD